MSLRSARTSLSLIADVISDELENEWDNDEFEEAFLSMTGGLKESDQLYLISEADIAKLPISKEKQKKIVEALLSFEGPMPADDFDIFIQLRG